MPEGNVISGENHNPEYTPEEGPLASETDHPPQPSTSAEPTKDNMETHYHPDLHHKKKHFKEYLLEFLMIFLAVTMGFIAENVREHFTERSKEKEYIRGIIRNLQDDTASLRHVINSDFNQINGIDSFLTLKHADMKQSRNRQRFYFFAFGSFYNSASFSSNDNTLQQLKSTGDYRLIVRDHVTDSLSKYDAVNQGISSQTDYYKDYFKEILSRLDEMIDVTVLGDTSYVKNGMLAGYALPELTADKTQLHTLFNKAFDFKIITASYANDMLKPQLANATQLISFLKKEYNIEGE